MPRIFANSLPALTDCLAGCTIKSTPTLRHDLVSFREITVIDALIANSCAVFLRKYGPLLATLILVSALGALAQTNSGQIRGSVTDPTGAVIPNASVSITTADGHTVATATSNSAGAYQAGHL